MKMTSDETSFALLKSSITEYVDANKVRSKINFLGSRVFDFSVKSRARKLKKAQTKRVKKMGVKYF